MQLLRATTDDVPAVLNIYNEVRGKGFCVAYDGRVIEL